MSQERRAEAERPESADAARLRERIARAVDRFAVDGMAAADSVCRDAPDLLPIVQRRLRVLDGLGLLAATPDDGDAATIPDRLGEFRLEERLAGGGMGVVYRATQESVGRQVALKVIHPEQLFLPRARERFRREIEALARLRHPGIVTIHSCGEEGGVPFFAMDLLDGLTLQQVLGELRDVPPATVAPALVWQLLQRHSRSKVATPMPDTWRTSWSDWCLRIVGEVAAAIGHAHAHGILHRDLKPSNVMLAADGRACVIDFGLAASDDSSDGMTKVGSLLGSLPYMAPEQLEGRTDAIDTRTDVYALGVTLYELLTRRVAFPQTSSGDLRQHVLGGRFTRPRRIDHGIPHDVETICVVAMDAQPGRRYQSMPALVADVAHHFARRPIAARREPLLRRAWRQVRHRPALVAAVAGALLLLGAWPLIRAYVDAEAEQRAAPHEVAATLAQQKARDYFREIGRTFDGLLQRIEREHAQQYPDTAALRREVFQQAVEAYSDIDSRNPGDPLLRRELGRSFERLAQIEHGLGNTEGAQAAFRQAIGFLTELRQQFPDDDDLVYQQARCTLRVGDLLDTLGRDGEQLQSIDQALELIADLIARHPDTADYLSLQIEALGHLGSLHGDCGRAAAARQAFERALAAARTFEARFPDDGWLDADLGVLQSDFGAFLQRSDAIDDAVAVLEAARTGQQQRLQRRPDSPSMRRTMARILVNLAAAYGRAGREPDMVSELEASVTLLEQLAAAYPSQWVYGMDLASAHNNLALALDYLEREPAAQEQYDRSLAVLERLAARHPDVPMVAGRYGATLSNLADVQFGAGDYDRALEMLQRARPFQARARAAQPDNRFAVIADRNSRWLLALTQARRGELEAAMQVVAALVQEPETVGEDWDRAGGYLASGCEQFLAVAPAGASRDAVLDAVAGRVIGYLRQADTMGALDREDLRSSPAFEWLATRPDFRAFLGEVGGNR